MYGISDTSVEVDEIESKKKPVTEYAKTKWEAEIFLNSLNDENFTVVSFRPSTVFGPSPRLRCDIVFNSFVASAFTTGSIEILSDGTPWRPVVHVDDVCSAFIAGLVAPKEIINGEAFNVGIKNGNYNVRDLQEQKAGPMFGLITYNMVRNQFSMPEFKYEPKKLAIIPCHKPRQGRLFMLSTLYKEKL